LDGQLHRIDDEIDDLQQEWSAGHTAGDVRFMPGWVIILQGV
jgi:hypothetical protein